MTDGQDGSGAKAIPEFHHWADNRRQRSWHVAFFVRYIAVVVPMAISSGCISLARIVAPMP
jgi:uncharacterized sodium:solute symporter family permease YidK